MDASIKEVELVDGSIITFDQNLGSYDAENEVIKGMTNSGRDTTIPLVSVKRVLVWGVTHKSNSLLLTLLLVGFAVLLGIAVYKTAIPPGGCMMAIISIGMMLAAIIIIPICLASCSNPSHCVSRAKLEPAPDPNIEKIELADGATIEFNRALGWYNSENGTIEGMTRNGIRDTIPMSHIKSVEIAGDPNGAGTFLIVLLGMTVALIAAFIYSISQSGGL